MSVSTRRQRAPVVRVEGYAPIGDYAAIGDGRTIALVARDGSIDWLPLPRLDGATVFGALLDATRGDCFRLAPQGEYTVRRRYRPGTNVLETTFTTDTGRLRVVDAINLQDGGLVPWVELVRLVECLAGTVQVRWSVTPRFGYGVGETQVEERRGVPVASGDRQRLAVLAWDVGTSRYSTGERSSAEIAGAADLVEGDSGLIACISTESEPMPLPEREEIETRLRGTTDAWKRWLDGIEYSGGWRRDVERSALALKLLVYVPSGAMVAAGTSGLPEKIGGSRNYDYRFAWVRDTTLTLDVLSSLGHREQVHGSLSWLLDVTRRTHPRMQPLYGLDGRVPRTLQKLPLDGYRGSRPVEIGNGAATQLQLGTFGDLFETVGRYVDHGNVLDEETGRRLADAADLLCAIWRNEDSGLWELGQHRHYTSSKIGCWLALRRAVNLARAGQMPERSVERWEETAALVREFVETRCFSEQKGSYTFYAGTEDLDCAVILALGLGYLDPADRRVQGTIEAIRRELSGGGPLLYRYTGVEGEEGCFLACSFWIVSALAQAGRLAEAEEMLAELLRLGNDVGLYAEEIDASTWELLGNFPQALTHLSLLRAIRELDTAHDEKGG